MRSEREQGKESGPDLPCDPVEDVPKRDRTEGTAERVMY